MFNAKIIYLNIELDKHSIENVQNKCINKMEYYLKKAIGKDLAT